MLSDAFASLQKLMLPDRWQADALAGLRAAKDVIVDAPTGAGKTYVFERWAEQGNFAKRALFTVPTRALANDKFAEWRARGWRVGIMTGDLCIEPDAPVVVATLEAVQGLVVTAVAPEPRVRPAGAPFQLLVIDEYQWIGDAHRGNHYEGVLLSAPRELQLLLLSGSVANPGDVAAWLTRLGRDVAVVQHRERPVQLEEVDVDDLTHGLPRVIEGFWSKRVAGALREGLGPVLVFAPHRRDAERLARQFARELPLADALTLTPEQEQLCGPVLAKLLKARVAYHHSGLSYGQRAGVIEPLAKAGQLRAVVATLGLSAGINFSLRSVMVTAGSYRHGAVEREIAPHELLQMIGRAGRRGLDEMGYVLVSRETPRMRRAEQLRLKRAVALPWAFFLRQLRGGRSAAELATTEAERFFSDARIPLGVERREKEASADNVPCGEETDTGRARLVRRERNPFAGCRTCARREACLALNPQPTLLWQWQRTDVLDRALKLTVRGEIVSFFLGPEGLALSAALENRRYPVEDVLFDAANLFGGERFCGTNPRRLGRLAAECARAYRRLTIDGWLHEGLPVNYGSGASEAVRALVADGARRREVLDEIETAGRGDLDRLLTEWRSLLRQAAAAGPLAGDGAPMTGRDQFIAERWDEFRWLARDWLNDSRANALPDLPPLTMEQRRVVNHSVLRAKPPAPPGRQMAPRATAAR